MQYKNTFFVQKFNVKMWELFKKNQIIGWMRFGRSKIALLILATITVPVPTLHSNGEDRDKEIH